MGKNKPWACLFHPIPWSSSVSRCMCRWVVLNIFRKGHNYTSASKVGHGCCIWGSGDPAQKIFENLKPKMQFLKSKERIDGFWTTIIWCDLFIPLNYKFYGEFIHSHYIKFMSRMQHEFYICWFQCYPDVPIIYRQDFAVTMAPSSALKTGRRTVKQPLNEWTVQQTTTREEKQRKKKEWVNALRFFLFLWVYRHWLYNGSTQAQGRQMPVQSG